MVDADFYSASFKNSEFADVDMRGTNFRDATFDNLDIMNAKIAGANFSGAKFSVIRNFTLDLKDLRDLEGTINAISTIDDRNLELRSHLMKQVIERINTFDFDEGLGSVLDGIHVIKNDALRIELMEKVVNRFNLLDAARVKEETLEIINKITGFRFQILSAVLNSNYEASDLIESFINRTIIEIGLGNGVPLYPSAFTNVDSKPDLI